jgi:hypothetical protein
LTFSFFVNGGLDRSKLDLCFVQTWIKLTAHRSMQPEEHEETGLGILLNVISVSQAAELLSNLMV